MGRRECRRELDLGVGGSVGGSQTSVLNFYFGIPTTLADFQTYGWAGVWAGVRPTGGREVGGTHFCPLLT